MARPVILYIKEANLLRSRLRSVLAFRNLLHDENVPDAIHDMRVASRRLREVLDYLQLVLPLPVYERMSQSARQITRTLGGTREAEVNLEMLRDFAATKNFDPSMIEVLIYSERKKLARGRRKLFNGRIEESCDTLQKYLERVKGSYSAMRAHSPLLARRASEFAGTPDVDSLDETGLHDLRIRTKKFRYALEIHARLYNAGLRRVVARMKKLQDILGRFHDLHVLQVEIDGKAERYRSHGLDLLPDAMLSLSQALDDQKSGLAVRIKPLYEELVKATEFLHLETQLKAVVPAGKFGT